MTLSLSLSWIFLELGFTEGLPSLTKDRLERDHVIGRSRTKSSSSIEYIKLGSGVALSLHNHSRAMFIPQLPTELIVAIAKKLRTEAEEKPSVAACRDFVSFSQSSRHFYNVAEASIRVHPEFNREFNPEHFLTKEQIAHVTAELGMDQATGKPEEARSKAWLKSLTPISIWARRVGKICWFCPNKIRHSLYGEAFTGLGMCQVCEDFLFPKMGFETLKRLLDKTPFRNRFEESRLMPYDDRQTWRAYPHGGKSNSFEFTRPHGVHIPLHIRIKWEICTRRAVQPGNVTLEKVAYNIDKLTTWSHAKALLDKALCTYWCEHTPYVNGEDLNLFIKRCRALGGWQIRNMLQQETSWWTYRRFQYPRSKQRSENAHEADDQMILYFEFRYRFDPWWHDNKTMSEMYNEFTRVWQRWKDRESVPWSVSHFPKLPPCSIIPSYWQPRRHGEKDQPKRKYYNRQCTTLRQFFWKNRDILEDPKLYFDAVLKLPKEIINMIPLGNC